MRVLQTLQLLAYAVRLQEDANIAKYLDMSLLSENLGGFEILCMQKVVLNDPIQPGLEVSL